MYVEVPAKLWQSVLANKETHKNITRPSHTAAPAQGRPAEIEKCKRHVYIERLVRRYRYGQFSN